MNEKPPHFQGSYSKALAQAGVTDADALVPEIIRTAKPAALLALRSEGRTLPFAPVGHWLREDHPARVNLILEALGREVRL